MTSSMKFSVRFDVKLKNPSTLLLWDLIFYFFFNNLEQDAEVGNTKASLRCVNRKIRRGKDFIVQQVS